MIRFLVFATLVITLPSPLSAQAFFTNLMGTWKATSDANESNSSSSIIITNKGIQINEGGRAVALLPIDKIDERQKRVEFKYDGYPAAIQLVKENAIQFIADCGNDTPQTRNFNKLIKASSREFKKIKGLMGKIQGKWRVTKSDVGLDHSILIFDGNSLTVIEEGLEDVKEALFLEKKTESKKHELNFVFYEDGEGFPLGIQLLEPGKMKIVLPDDLELKAFSNVFLDLVK